MGKLIDDFLRPHSVTPERTARRGWTGSILKVDRFGNLITNFLASEFPRAVAGGVLITLGVLNESRLAANHQQFRPGEVFSNRGGAGGVAVLSRGGFGRLRHYG